MRPLEVFGNDKQQASGKGAYCKVHRREYDRKYHPRRVHYVRKVRYGITKEQYEKLLEEQGGRCAICKRFRKLVVDHDHKTKQVRGLLCSGCNILLGHLGDDSSLLENGIKYLKRWPL